MDKIIVEVFFPSLQRAFDIEIPVNMRFHLIADLVEQSVSSISAGEYTPSGEALICDRISGAVFDINSSPDKQCLYNGSKLMII